MTVVKAAIISATGSAMKTKSNGAINAFSVAGKMKINGTNRIILRSKASTNEILACPNAKNVCWQATCTPKTNIPAKKIRRLRDVMATNSGLSLKILVSILLLIIYQK